MITDNFLRLVSNYTDNKALANNLWLEIFTKYSDAKRHYHNIAHLENLIIDLEPLQDLIEDWPTTLFALYYHDIVYKATSSTNEEDSATIAKERLLEIGYPDGKIQKCSAMIIATKLHKQSADSDINFLNDADLAILGQAPDQYQQYCENVRKEYSVYPEFIYNQGRKKVLLHFLEMDTIFRTGFFIEKYEAQARTNIHTELENL